MGVSHRPGFGLLGSVPRSLSTQPPFATQASIIIIIACFRSKLFDLTSPIINICNQTVKYPIKIEHFMPLATTL